MCFTIHPTEDDRVYLEQRGKPVTDHKLRVRMLQERLIVREAVKMLAAKGYGLQLGNGEQSLTPLTRQWQVIMKELQSCDEEYLYIYHWVAGVPKHRGTIYLVYGNDGYDVMADLSLWVDAELEAVNRLANTLADSTVVEGT